MTTFGTGTFGSGTFGQPAPAPLELRPGTELRIRAFHVESGVTYPVWRGFVETIGEAFNPSERPAVKLDCHDGYAQVGHINLPEQTPVGAGESSDARIHRLLDLADWPVQQRDVDDGRVTVQATNLARVLIDDVGITADSEGGAAYMTKDGLFAFRNRDWLRLDPRATELQATIGGEESVIPAGTVVEGTATVLTFPHATGGPEPWIAGDGFQYRIVSDDPVGIDWRTTEPALAYFERRGPMSGGLSGSFTVYDPSEGLVSYASYPPGTYRLFVGRTVPAAVCGAGYEIVRNGADIVNDVQVARAGGTLQRLTNETSVGRYMRRTYNRSDFICETDDQVLVLGQRVLASRSSGNVRMPRVTIRPFSADDFEFCLAVDYGWRIKIVYDPPDGTKTWVREMHVHGINHSVGTGNWETTLRVDDVYAEPVDYWDNELDGHGWDQALWSEVV